MLRSKKTEVTPISGFGKFMMRMVKNRSNNIDGNKADILIVDNFLVKLIPLPTFDKAISSD